MNKLLTMKKAPCSGAFELRLAVVLSSVLPASSSMGLNFSDFLF